MKNEIIKVRKPKLIKYFGFAERYSRYCKRQYKHISSLPKNGDKIKIVWFPDNRGVTNAYIGMSGIVENMKIDGNFCLNCGDCKLICSGDFDYIRLQ